MRPIVLLSCIATVLLIVVPPRIAVAVPQQIPFDRAYMVATPGSTTPVNAFDINGPAPVLYLDLPTQWGQYSSASSNFFADAGSTTAAQFSLSGGGLFTSDSEFWLSPTPEQWELTKSVGPWHANANYYWWTLVIIYGSGAPITNATGSATIPFFVENGGAITPVLIGPEPGSIVLCGFSIALLCTSRSSSRPRRS